MFVAPSRERELKHGKSVCGGYYQAGRSLTGAGIETRATSSAGTANASLPAKRKELCVKQRIF